MIVLTHFVYFLNDHFYFKSVRVLKLNVHTSKNQVIENSILDYCNNYRIMFNSIV